MNKFSIFDGLSAASVADADNTDRARLALTDVPYDKIYRNSDNFYPQSEIKELAAKILMVGLLPLIHASRVSTASQMVNADITLLGICANRGMRDLMWCQSA